MSSKYERRHGKLVKSIPVVVDEEMRQLYEAARDLGFDVQEWARDRLYPGKQELAQFVESKRATAQLAG